MKVSLYLKIIAASTVALIGLQVRADVLDFEDRPGAESSAGLVNYHGVSFDSNYFTYGEPQDPYNPSSGTVRLAFNNIDEGSVAESFFTFDVGNAIFAGAYFAGIPGNVYFNLYNDSVLVGVSSVLGLSATPTWLSSGYAGAVDQVGVVGNRGYLVMDDVTFTPGTGTPGNQNAVPDSVATLGLFGAAVVALGALRRRIRA